jgi:hypothetical protein
MEFKILQKTGKGSVTFTRNVLEIRIKCLLAGCQFLGRNKVVKQKK